LWRGRFHGKRVIAAGLAVLAQLTAASGYWLLAVGLVLLGADMGAAIPSPPPSRSGPPASAARVSMLTGTGSATPAPVSVQIVVSPGPHRPRSP
jgi:hypothetical protein